MTTIRYAVEARTRLPVLPGEPATYDLVEEYADTEDLRLAARGITLARTPGGAWHLDWAPCCRRARRPASTSPRGTSSSPTWPRRSERS